MALGTVEYMAPEQVLNSRDVTAASDLYALGALLYRAVAGKHMFGDLRDGHLAHAKITREAPPLQTGRGDRIARGLESVVAHALARRPADRYDRADLMVAELTSLRDLARLSTMDLGDDTEEGIDDARLFELRQTARMAVTRVPAALAAAGNYAEPPPSSHEATTLRYQSRQATLRIPLAAATGRDLLGSDEAPAPDPDARITQARRGRQAALPRSHDPPAEATPVPPGPAVASAILARGAALGDVPAPVSEVARARVGIPTALAIGVAAGALVLGFAAGRVTAPLTTAPLPEPAAPQATAVVNAPAAAAETEAATPPPAPTAPGMVPSASPPSTAAAGGQRARGCAARCQAGGRAGARRPGGFASEHGRRRSAAAGQTRGRPVPVATAPETRRSPARKSCMRSRVRVWVLAGISVLSGCDRRPAAQAAQDPMPAAASDRVAEARSDRSSAAPSAADGEMGAKVALVELFTSEGCSSCPPADDVLAKLERTMHARGAVTLSFHVDYWNELGWPDPWSSPVHTARQEQYARALGGRGLYTPQMIVNGRDAFVGSDAAHATDSVQVSLARPLPVALVASARPADGGLSVSYRADRVVPETVLSAAVAERLVQSRVTRGENAGQSLSHVNVVRAFRTQPFDRAEGELRMQLPRNLAAERALVVVYLQKRGSMEVVGVSAVDPVAR